MDTNQKSNSIWVIYFFQTIYRDAATYLELMLSRSFHCYIPLSHLFWPIRINTSRTILLIMAANQTSWTKVVSRRNHVRIVNFRRTDSYSTKTNKQGSRTIHGTTSKYRSYYRRNYIQRVGWGGGWFRTKMLL